MSILVIVDVQPNYPSADLALRKAVCRAIRAHRGPICILEYEGNGKTYPCVLKACKGRRVFYCEKNRDDGGEVVALGTYREGLGHHRHYKICGVNTAYCVLSTASGILRERFDSTVTILESACRTQFDDDRCNATRMAIDVWQREHYSRRKRAL